MTQEPALRPDSKLPETSLLVIEQAQRETPFCVQCASSTVPVARGAEVWLRCSESLLDRSLLERVLSLEFAGGHTRKLIIRDERISAA